MPYSSDEGKDWLAGHIWWALRTAPVHRDKESGGVLAPRVLDIGAGAGTYADLINRTDPGNVGCVHLTAVEVHAPYVTDFGLRGKYDEVIIGDARTLELPQAEVVILGDVLEHMILPDAQELWAKARRAATTAVFLSLPIVEWPQEAFEGNEFERHVETWSHELVLRKLLGIHAWQLGESVGVYGAIPARRPR